jgi:hypothetical protein
MSQQNQSPAATFFCAEFSSRNAFLRDSRINADCERRIDRCLAKMLKAKTFGWAKAWSALLVALCNERNGQRTAAELDALERARGLR